MTQIPILGYDKIEIDGRLFDLNGYYLAQCNARTCAILSKNDHNKNSLKPKALYERSVN